MTPLCWGKVVPGSALSKGLEQNNCSTKQKRLIQHLAIFSSVGLQRGRKDKEQGLGHVSGVQITTGDKEKVGCVCQRHLQGMRLLAG